jgi:hypothetical protein
MNPKLSKRILPRGSAGTRRVSLGSERDLNGPDNSVRNEAVLLLSIADIVKTEINSDSDVWSDNKDLPKFPLLSSVTNNTHTKLTPKIESESITDVISLAPVSVTGTYSSRVRSVSMDSNTGLRSMSPQCTARFATNFPNTITPVSSPKLTYKRKQAPTRKTTQRSSSKKAKYTYGEVKAVVDDMDTENFHPIASRTVCFVDQKTRQSPLQGTPPKGVPIKKIVRRKFSWKNYPELEQFLIANREEYLRHSALNYTVEQKQYNNRLTDRLLELSTDHGYIFDEDEFGFVTVRDRIRCYYKSYVQSAKKRGILMGYAARKAGLLSEAELSKGTGKAARILDPEDL